MFPLPLDILNEIQSHLPTLSQPQWRRVSKQTLQTTFDWQKQCCFPPTISEIADLFIAKKKDIMQHDLNIYVISNDILSDPDAYIFRITLDRLTGEIQAFGRGTPITLYTREDFINILTNKKINMDFINSSFYIENLKVIRSCLHKRQKCIEHGFNPDKCFIELCILYLSEYQIITRTRPFFKPGDPTKIDSYEGIFLILKSILNNEKLAELDLDFQKTFRITKSIRLTGYLSLYGMLSEFNRISIVDFRKWLILHLSELQTSDLLPIV